MKKIIIIKGSIKEGQTYNKLRYEGKRENNVTNEE